MTWAIVTGMAIGAAVGGGSAALQHKNVWQGVGLGALTGAAGAGIGSLLAPAAEVGIETAAPSVLSETTSPIASNFATGAPLNPVSTTGESIDELGYSPGNSLRLNNMSGDPGFRLPVSPSSPGMGGGTGITGMSPVGPSGGSYLTPPPAPKTGIDQLMSEPGQYLSDNKYKIGASALAGSIGPTTDKPPETDPVTYHPYSFSRTRNPSYTGAGSPYFNDAYTALPTYTAAEGGIMRLAKGGTAATDAYNAQLSQQAQKEYVGAPPLAAFTSHFNDPQPVVAPPENAASTNALYQKYLGRDADPSGLRSNASLPQEQTINTILSSPEYLKSHAGSVAPDPYKPDPNAPPPTITYNPQTRQYSTSYASTAPAGIAALPSQNTSSGGGGSGGGGSANGSGGAANGGLMGYADGGGIYNLGGYSDGGRLLKGPGDGVSDDIPAQIGQHQPARLADGEFVIPARIVSELGNGSTDAGAKRLYAMMDRVQANRSKTVGKGKVAVNSRSDKYLPA